MDGMEQSLIMSAEEFAREKARVILELKTFIEIYKTAVADFYSLEKDMKSRVNKEILQNFALSSILCGPIYVFIFNILSLSKVDEILKL